MYYQNTSKLREIWHHLWKNISENLKLWNVRKVFVPNFSIFRFEIATFWNLKFRKFKFRNFKTWHLKHGNWKFDIMELLSFEISESWTLENSHRKRMTSPLKVLQHIGYEFHNYQKTWNGFCVSFVFSSKGIPSTPQHSDSHPCTRPPSWVILSRKHDMLIRKIALVISLGI